MAGGFPGALEREAGAAPSEGTGEVTAPAAEVLIGGVIGGAVGPMEGASDKAAEAAVAAEAGAAEGADTDTEAAGTPVLVITAIVGVTSPPTEVPTPSNKVPVVVVDAVEAAPVGGEVAAALLANASAWYNKAAATYWVW